MEKTLGKKGDGFAASSTSVLSASEEFDQHLRARYDKSHGELHKLKIRREVEFV